MVTVRAPQLLGKWYAMVRLKGIAQADSTVYVISKTSNWDFDMAVHWC